MQRSRCLRCLLCQRCPKFTIERSLSSTSPLSIISQTNPRSSQPQTPHWFESHTPVLKYKRQIVKDLMRTKIYEDEYILVLNKPHGLPMHSPKYTEHQETGGPEGPEISLASIIPELQETVKSKWMECMYTQPRLTSGIIVMAKKERAVKILSKYFVHTRTTKSLHQKYWAVTVGIPKPPSCETEKLFVRLDRISGWKLGVKVMQDSRRKRLNREMILAEIGLKTLTTYKSSQASVAFVELTPSTTKWDALNVFLLHKLVSVLGDHQYSPRLKEILGRPAILDHRSHLPAPRVLPQDIRNKLGLSAGTDTSIIPRHLHCGQLELPLVHPVKGFMKSDTLTVTAPVPSYFLRTMKTFNLMPEALIDSVPESLP